MYTLSSSRNSFSKRFFIYLDWSSDLKNTAQQMVLHLEYSLEQR